MTEETTWPKGHSLEKGACGHPVVFLFKCPERHPEDKCVDCLLCRLILTSKLGRGAKSCDPEGAKRPDYDELPDGLTPENLALFHTVEDIGSGMYLGKQITDIFNRLGEEVKRIDNLPRGPKDATSYNKP